jgi:hypothetical protein
LDLLRVVGSGDQQPNYRFAERSLTTTVNDIEHIESESLAGFSIIKIFIFGIQHPRSFNWVYRVRA